MFFLFLFYYYASFVALTNSFQEVSLGFQAKFIGLANYRKILSDVLFLSSLRNQLVLTVAAIFANLFFPFVAAGLLFFIRRKLIASFIKSSFVLPMLVPTIVTIMIWRFLYGSNYGINNLLHAAGLGAFAHDWLNEDTTALFAVIFVGFPFVSGLYFLILHAAINNVPKEFYDAGVIDGCSTWDIVRHIHIPALMPYFSLIVTLSTINSFQNYGLILATTKGGPGYETLIPSVHMYNVAFRSNDIGYGSALGIVILLMIVAVTLISRRFTRSK